MIDRIIQVGEQVRIIDDLDLRTRYEIIDGNGEVYGGYHIGDGMLKYAGKTATVTDFIEDYGNSEYKLDIDDGYWLWSNGMLEEAIDPLPEFDFDPEELLGDFP